VIVHYHIMKNAGSTIASVLGREFGAGFADLDTQSANGLLTPADLQAHLAANPHIRALTSHQIRLPAPDTDSIIVFECCFLREPIDRLVSLFSYLRKAGDATALGALAVAHGLAGFFAGLLDRFPHMVLNPQTTIVANGGRFTRPPDEDDCARGIQMMRKLAVPGVVSRFEESLAAAEYFLQPAFPDLRLHYASQNVSRLPMADQERDREIREALGEGMYREVARLNELDMRLFRATEQEVERRVGLVPDFARRVADLKQRCAAMESFRPAVV